MGGVDRCRFIGAKNRTLHHLDGDTIVLVVGLRLPRRCAPRNDGRGDSCQDGRLMLFCGFMHSPLDSRHYACGGIIAGMTQWWMLFCQVFGAKDRTLLW